MGTTLEETLAEMQEEAQAAAGARAASSRPIRPPAPKKAPSLPPKPSLGSIAKDIVTGPLNPYSRAGVVARQRLAASVGAGIVRAPGQLIGGVVDTSYDAGRFIGDNILPGLARGKKQGTKTVQVQAEVLDTLGRVARMLPTPEAQAISGALSLAAETGRRRAVKKPIGASLADVLSARSTLGQVGYPAVNQFVAEAAATVIPMAVPGGGLLAAGGKAALGGAVGIEADDLSQRGVNAAIAGSLEIGGALVIKGGALLYRRFITEGTPKEAAADALDRAFATVRSEDVRAQQLADASPDGVPKPEPEEIIPQESPASGTRVADVAEPGSDAALVSDANMALERSGAAERLPEGLPPEITPDGRIKVAPETKQAVDEAGFGRAFAAADETPPDVVIFREEATDGSSRVVGSMGRDDLAAFTDEVSHYRNNPGEIDLPAGAPKGQWSMARLGAPYDAASVLRAVVDRVPPSSRRVTDPELMEMAQAAADHFGATTEEALAFAREIAGEAGDAATALKATQTIWTRMGSELDDYLSTDWLDADDDLLEAVAARIHSLQMFSMAMEAAKAGTGRALRSLSLPDADTYLANLRKAATDPTGVPPAETAAPAPMPRTREEMDQWMQMWDALKDDPGARANFLKGVRTYPSGLRYLRESFPNFFTGAILSGPRTITLNVLNPAVMGGLRTLERTAGGAIAGINPLLRPAQREAARSAAAHAPVAYIQSLSDIATAFKYAARTFDAEGLSALAGKGANPLEVRPLFSMKVPEPVIRAAQADGKSAIPYHLGNMINFLPRAVWRLHGTTNELALHVAYMGELRAKAMLEASEAGLKGADARALVASRLAEGVDGPGGAATDAATLDSAHRTTMVRQPDPEFNPGYAAFSRTINTWRNNVPELRYVLPIFQVPANGMGEALRRTPMGFLFKETQMELSGALGAFRQAEAHGRLTLGAGFLVAGAMLARNSLITGGGPRDPKDRRVWLMTHQPYSLRLGDRWVAYDRLDPIAPLLAIAAGYYDESVYVDTDRDMTWAAVGALGQYFKDKAALQGIADLLNIGGDPTEQATFERRLGSIVGGFVPAFLRPIVAGIDPVLSVKTNPWDYIRANLPGVSKTLDPVRNIIGEMVMKPQESALESLLPVSTQRIAPWGEDPVVDEIDRLYQLTGYTPGMLSPSAGPGTALDMRTVKLEDGYSLYNALMRGRLEVTVDGQTLRDHLQALIASPEYLDAPDGTGRVDDPDEGPRIDTRGYLLQRAFSQYSAAVETEVARESPLAKRYLAAASAKRTANDVLRPYSVDEIASDPSLLEALGIDMNKYEAAAAGEDQ